MHLLDSDYFIYFLKGKKIIKTTLEKIQDKKVFTSIICVAEVLEGLTTTQEKEKFLKTLNIFQVIDNRLIQCQNLGYIEGLSGHKTYLFLDECLNKTLYDFLNVAFPKNDTMVAVIMKINNINCRNKQSLFHVSAIVNIEIEYLPFEEARVFVRSLNLENTEQWNRYYQGKLEGLEKPENIPWNPKNVYANEWNGIGDWLGKEWRSFNEAREFVRNLGLKGQVEWRLYCKNELHGYDAKPQDIPSAPQTVYENRGWIDISNWLGTERKRRTNHGEVDDTWLSYEDAKEYVRSIKLSSYDEWKAYIDNRIENLPARPMDLPKSPQFVYKNDGWTNWSDWLGNNIDDVVDKKHEIKEKNLIEIKELQNGKHRTIWGDPSKKPCYLFALVAGDFDELKDQFETASGKLVDLYLYVEKGYADQASYALSSLKQAMIWDEKAFGREYDLNRYTIVAVNDFNSGAMENKALNIFNTKYVLAKPETAVDDDYVVIESVIGHEYFHNWTGDRITCRDWFQLTLKEGLTVLRDQLFTEDRTTKLMGRIKSAHLIRNRQFSEDTGPTAHPIRPETYMAVDNLYTLTVYYKGAEVIRMIRTLMGEQGFRKGMDLYFERHDGQAVTTEEFVKAMEEANDYDLTQFRLWYSQKGIPILTVTDHYDTESKCYQLIVKQKPPVVCGKPLTDSKPFHFPFTVGLLDSAGNSIGGERVLEIKEKEQSFIFENVPSKPVPSLLRHFSAPVRCHYDYSNEQLALLMNKDPDAFNRWWASQTLMTRLALSLIKKKQPFELDTLLLDTFEDILAQQHEDYHLIAQLLTLPMESYLIEQCEEAEVDAIHIVHQFLKQQLGVTFEKHWLKMYQNFYRQKPYQYNISEIARRAFQNLCLQYLLMNQKENYYQLALKQVKEANNMTDSFAALTALNDHDCFEREEALKYFYHKWQHESLVMDKWLTLQASSTLPNTLEKVKELMKLSVFDIYNPNKVRALIGAFTLNPIAFHQKDGKGYQFLAEQVLIIDTYNRQLAGRIIEPLIQWRKYEKSAQEKMKAELIKLKENDEKFKTNA